MSLSGQFEVEPEVLKTEGFNFFTAGQEFSKALGRLQTGLTALEGTGIPPWGDDDLGEKFGVVYEGLRDGMYESMGSLSERLAGIGTALAQMAVTYETNEQSTTDAMRDRTSDLQSDEGQSQFL